MELLALPPFAAGSNLPQQITLEMLEEALANVSALMSWVCESFRIDEITGFLTFLVLRSAGAEVVDVTSRQLNSSNLPSYDLKVNQTILKFRLNVRSIFSSTEYILTLIPLVELFPGTQAHLPKLSMTDVFFI